MEQQRFKNVYRPRYLYGDRLQEPQKTRPGQNILSAIKNCFEDANSQVYFKKPGQIMGMNSLLSLESGNTMIDSESGEEENTEQIPLGDEGVVLLGKEHIKAATKPGVVRNLVKSLDQTYILEQSAVQNPASPTITLPTKKRLSFRNLTEPDANNIKGMRMFEKDPMCTTEEKQSEIQHNFMAAEKKNHASPHKKRKTLTGFNEKRPSNVVSYTQNPLSLQQDEIENDEDEFLIAEVDSIVVDSWISNPKKSKSDLPGSMSARSRKSQLVLEEAKSIQRNICDRDHVLSKELSSENVSYGHNANMSPNKRGSAIKRNLSQRFSENDFDCSDEVQHLQQTLSNSQVVSQLASQGIFMNTATRVDVQSPNEKITRLRKNADLPGAKEEVKLPKTKVMSTSKSGHIKEIDIGGSFQKQKKQSDLQSVELTHSLKDAADFERSDVEEGKKHANVTNFDYHKEDKAETCLPKKALCKSNHAVVSVGKRSIAKKTVQSSAFEQTVDKPEMLEKTWETEGVVPLVNSQKSEKRNHLFEIRNPRSPVCSMFLQAATQGHASRYSIVPEAPGFDTPHQGEEDENDFVFDDAALLDCDPLISIPRKGKPVPLKKTLLPESDTDALQHVMEQDKNVSAIEQNKQVTPKKKSTKENPTLSRRLTLNAEKLLGEVDNGVITHRYKGRNVKSASVHGLDELEENVDNCALSDEHDLQKTSSKKQALSKTNKGKPVKKAQKKKQTQKTKSKPSLLNRNKNDGQGAVNSDTGSSEEVCTSAEIQKPSTSAQISINSKVASPTKRDIFSSEENENPNVTNTRRASSSYKRVKTKDIKNLQFPEIVSPQDLKQTSVPNQRLQAVNAAEKVINTPCDQMESGRRQRISRPPSQWWIVSPSQKVAELPPKTLENKKNKLKNKKGTKKGKIPDANEGKGFTVTTPSKVQTPLKKGNKRQLKGILPADDDCAVIPVTKSAIIPNVCDNTEVQDSEMYEDLQKMPKSIVKKNNRRSKKLISSEEECADFSEDDEHLDNVCQVPQAQESQVLTLYKLMADSQKHNFRGSVATYLDSCDESPDFVDQASERSSESDSDCITNGIKAGKTLMSTSKDAQLEEIKLTPRLQSTNSEGIDKPNPRSHQKYREDLYTSTVGSGPALPRTVCLTSANERPITYEPYTSSSGSEIEYGTQLHQEKIIQPSKTPNVRRSKRTRVKPLAYWKGERVNYKIRPSGGFLVEGVVPPAEVEPPRKALAKRRVYRKQKGDIPTCVEPPKDDYLEPANVIDVATGTITSIECVCTSEDCFYHWPDKPVSICKSISTSDFSTGKVKIGPLQEKGLQYVCLHTIVFYIMTGSVQLTLHLTTYNLKTGDFFYIPPGNMYKITNLLNEDALLIFTQIKG
ncbi:hypothetical protein XENTR_v10001060 [Xenopus tropicalis]|uniref:Centromere protein C n=1 Tax=Xenopus tropicalis TaxID=8364 RepID=A0A8J0QS85_XENTR|nr:centromere protein C isoform X2 [Xenopus tropicalis]KAE8631060.1 hypothetical protein XENTR_v10001060 [Xenopus tropicalis]